MFSGREVYRNSTGVLVFGESAANLWRLYQAGNEQSLIRTIPNFRGVFL